MSNESINKITLDDLKKRVTKIEEQQENHYEKIIENNTQLTIIVAELKSITKSMESLTSSWKEAISNSEEKHEMEKQQMNDRLNRLEATVSKLSEKLDDRTIGKNSSNWEKSIWIIISAIVGAIATMIATNIIK